MNKCDMCGSNIKNGHCECGEWKSPEDCKGDPMKLAIEQFNEMKRFTLTGDAPPIWAVQLFFSEGITMTVKRFKNSFMK